MLVPPFDDPRTMADQGTVATEILAGLPGPPDAVVVPVGGSGLMAGIAALLRERVPSTRLIGAEIELGSPGGLEPLLSRMKASPMRIEQINPGSPAYAYLT